MSFQVDAYLNNPKNWRKTGKKRYEIWCCKPPVGTVVQNKLEGAQYTVGEMDFVLSGFAGEQWCIKGDKLLQGYTLLDGRSIQEKWNDRNVDGCLDWFKVKTVAESHDAFACFLPMQYYQNFPVIRSYGTLVANRPEVGHGLGDFLVAPSKDGQPIIQEARVCNGLIFPLTYNITRFDSSCFDPKLDRNMLAPEPETLLNAVKNNDQFNLFKRIFCNDTNERNFSYSDTVEGWSCKYQVGITGFGLTAIYEENGQRVFQKNYLTFNELYSDYAKVAESVSKHGGKPRQFCEIEDRVLGMIVGHPVSDGKATVTCDIISVTALSPTLTVAEVIVAGIKLPMDSDKFFVGVRSSVQIAGYKTLHSALMAAFDATLQLKNYEGFDTPFETEARKLGHEVKYPIARRVVDNKAVGVLRCKIDATPAPIFRNLKTNRLCQSGRAGQASMYELATIDTLPVKTILERGIFTTVYAKALKDLGFDFKPVCKEGMQSVQFTTNKGTLCILPPTTSMAVGNICELNTKKVLGTVKFYYSVSENKQALRDKLIELGIGAVENSDLSSTLQDYIRSIVKPDELTEAEADGHTRVDIGDGMIYGFIDFYVKPDKSVTFITCVGGLDADGECAEFAERPVKTQQDVADVINSLRGVLMLLNDSSITKKLPDYKTFRGYYWSLFGEALIIYNALNVLRKRTHFTLASGIKVDSVNPSSYKIWVDIRVDDVGNIEVYMSKNSKQFLMETDTFAKPNLTHRYECALSELGDYLQKIDLKTLEM